MESGEGVSLSMKELSIGCDLREDVLFKQILTKLDVKDVVRFKCVSKAWLARFSTDSFIAGHLHYHSHAGKPSYLLRAENKDDSSSRLRLFGISHGGSKPVEMDMSFLRKRMFAFDLIGSSNGLLYINAFDKRYDSQLVVSNPATREFMEIPKPVPVSGNHERVYRFDHHGFGFGKDFDDYKIVQIRECHKILDIQLFTKRSGCWRELEVLPDCHVLIDTPNNGGLVMDGAIHWPMLYGPSPTTPAKGTLFRVLTFDLNSDEFKVIDGPTSENDDLYDDFELFKWKGSLGAILNAADGDESHIFVKGKGTSWTKIFAIGPHLMFHGVCRDEFVLYNRASESTFFFDPITKTERIPVEDYGVDLEFFGFHQYVPSLISPN